MPGGAGSYCPAVGHSPVAWLFVSVLVTFLVTRGITRFIRHRSSQGGAGPLRDVVMGGVHIHHQVFGIATMSVTGIVLIAATPEGTGLDVAAAVFGVGVSLTFDEFALWLHLEDVYWAQAGRASVDAVFCILVAVAAMIGGVDFLVGPVGSSAWWNSVVSLLIAGAFSLTCVLKGKLVTALIGLFLGPVAIVGAIRLAKPGSWWARRRYASRPGRLAVAERRFGTRYQARWNRLRDLVGGAPTAGPAAAPTPAAPERAADPQR